MPSPETNKFDVPGIPTPVLAVGLLVLLVANVAAFLAGQARFYALCLNMSVGTGYLIFLLPIVLSILVLTMVSFEMIPREHMGVMMAIASGLGQLVTLYAAFRLMTGGCYKSLS